jgi:hypothetical protein
VVSVVGGVSRVLEMGEVVLRVRVVGRVGERGVDWPVVDGVCVWVEVE